MPESILESFYYLIGTFGNKIIDRKCLLGKFACGVADTVVSIKNSPRAQMYAYNVHSFLTYPIFSQKKNK